MAYIGKRPEDALRGNASYNAFTGDGSTTTFDVGTQAETSMFRIVRSAEDVDNEDLTTAGANIVVVMNAAANLYT